ncbi:MAG: IS3 family transposase [Chromatiaceae bacterium]|nr:MAG: IS3 family transposase [Chromatiaceae bacterium]
MVRRNWIEPTAGGACSTLSLRRQCELVGVARSGIYRLEPKQAASALDLELLRLIDAAYTHRPFYGSRRMVVSLRAQGDAINRKRVQRLMRVLGLAGLAPGPLTSKPHSEHKIHPYLLRGMTITRPDQVWSTDITSVRLANGFAYLVAIIDWYSRRVLAWRLSNTLESGFCVDCLQEALRVYGAPEIFNTDQGTQFTSTVFTQVLKDAEIAISMDGRGRALDNIFVERLWRSVKYEDIYPRGYETLPELLWGLTEYFVFYNSARPHQSLGYRTPEDVHQRGQGGGAAIVDHFNNREALGQRQTAAIEASGIT